MSSSVPYYDAAAVETTLDLPGCIGAVRAAMIALSNETGGQPLRQIIDLGSDRLFGVMPGYLTSLSKLGAKLVSVFPDSERAGRSRHRGVVIVFDLATGEPVCMTDAESITAIRTACATAVATEALARADADTLAVFGTGLQAEMHVRALAQARRYSAITIWGRSQDRATDLARRLTRELGTEVRQTNDARMAARGAGVICTVTSATTPILLGEWVEPGTQVNLVGSSMLGPVEVDTALVAMGRYIADYRPSVLAQASEFAVARAAGIVGDDKVAGEIGQVIAGTLAGREKDEQITIYKSLGHIVQDLAAAAYVHQAHG